MSNDSKKHFLRGAAFALAATFTTPSFTGAEALKPPIPQEVTLNRHAHLLRDIMTVIGYDLQKTSTREVAASLRANVSFLQEALNAYAKDHPHLRLETVIVDGILGKDTARLTLRVAREENIIEALIVPKDTDLPEHHAKAIKTFSDRLAAIIPVEFTDAMRDVILTVSAESRMNFDGAINALRIAFRHCAGNDGRAYAPQLIDEEIDLISSSTNYISRFIPENCTPLLRSLPPDVRGQEQLNFLALRPRTAPPDKQPWCLVSESGKCTLHAI